jgi:hypothetical protein
MPGSVAIIGESENRAAHANSFRELSCIPILCPLGNSKAAKEALKQIDPDPAAWLSQAGLQLP